MDLDAFVRRQTDILLARRLCALLLWAPLATVPATMLIDFTLVGALDARRNPSSADAILLHLPGLLNLYPLYRLMRFGRLNARLLLPAALGVLSYVIPQLVWGIFVAMRHLSPPLVDDPILVVGVIVQSNFYSFILWCLTLSVYQSYRAET